jgi:hypothetical protein
MDSSISRVSAESFLSFGGTVEAMTGFVLSGFAGLCMSARSHQRNGGVIPTQEYLLHQAIHSGVFMIAGLVTLASMGAFNGKIIWKKIARSLTPVFLVVSLIMNVGLLIWDFMCIFGVDSPHLNMYASDTGYKFTMSSRVLLFSWLIVLYIQLIPVTLWIMATKRFGLKYYDVQAKNEGKSTSEVSIVPLMRVASKEGLTSLMGKRSTI